MRWAGAHAHAPSDQRTFSREAIAARGFVIRAVSRCGLGGLLTFEEFTQPFDAGQPVGRRLTQLLLSPGHIFAFDFLRVEAHHEPVADGQRGGRHWKRHSKTNCDEKNVIRALIVPFFACVLALPWWRKERVAHSHYGYEWMETLRSFSRGKREGEFRSHHVARPKFHDLCMQVRADWYREILAFRSKAAKSCAPSCQIGEQYFIGF